MTSTEDLRFMQQLSKEAAANHNTEGIEHLRSGRYGKATQSFYRSLKAIQTVLDIRAETIQRTAGGQHNSAASGLVIDAESSSYQGHICSVAVQEVGLRDLSDDDLFVLFRWPLNVADAGDEAQGQTEDAHEAVHMHLMTTAVLFNIALSHHLQGLREGDSDLITRALGLYVMGYNALSGGPSHTSENSSKKAVVALLALMNNIGHIHAHFRRLEEADSCSEEISRCLAMIATSAESPLSRNDYQIFFLNGCLFQKDFMAAPPAA